jgi:hypothetical protein
MNRWHVKILLSLVDCTQGRRRTKIGVDSPADFIDRRVPPLSGTIRTANSNPSLNGLLGQVLAC